MKHLAHHAQVPSSWVAKPPPFWNIKNLRALLLSPCCIMRGEETLWQAAQLPQEVTSLTGFGLQQNYEHLKPSCVVTMAARTWMEADPQALARICLCLQVRSCEHFAGHLLGVSKVVFESVHLWREIYCHACMHAMLTSRSQLQNRTLVVLAWSRQHQHNKCHTPLKSCQLGPGGLCTLQCISI